MSTPPTTKETELTLLESGKRLSECLLWEMQENYYANAGIAAWNHIPFYPTSNPFIADIYAEVLLGVFQDIHPSLNREEPIYLIELATGTGTFSFYFMKAFYEKMAAFSALKDLRFIYVMTDFAEKNFSAWRESPNLKPFLEANRLDFAIFRPEDQDRITLSERRVTLSADTVKNPVVAIANYFFDSIRQDAFRVDHGKLLEGRLTFQVPTVTACEEDPVKALAQLVKTETYTPVDPEYYPDPTRNTLLQQYLEYFEQGSILFPTGALGCLENLLTLSDNNLILLSSDKGFTYTDYMQGHFEHSYTPHHGAFSFMVNYDAIRRYFEAHQGTFYATPDRNPMMATGMGILLKDFLTEKSPLEWSQYLFEKHLAKENKINDLFYCQSFIFHSNAKTSREMMNAYFALLRMSGHDPVIFCGCADEIYNILHEIEDEQRTRLLEELEAVRANVYMHRRDHNVLFWVGKLYYGMNKTDEALEAFTEAVKHFGESDCHSMYHIAACHEMQGRDELALAYYQKAAQYLTSCEITRNAIERLSKRLSQSL